GSSSGQEAGEGFSEGTTGSNTKPSFSTDTAPTKSPASPASADTRNGRNGRMFSILRRSPHTAKPRRANDRRLPCFERHANERTGDSDDGVYLKPRSTGQGIRQGLP